MKDDAMIYDILKEVFNISVGKAAKMLSDIVDQKIRLQVPKVEIIDTSTQELEVIEYLPERIRGALMVSSISFEESFTGTANLIFPADKMKQFIKLCMHEEDGDQEEMEFHDIDFDILKEIGNIILNCIMGETGNFLEINFHYSLPEVKVFHQETFYETIKNSKYKNILVLYITFVIGDTEIEGAIIVELTLDSLNELLRKVGQAEERLYD
ncbi:MAG: chemotaxis protein CheC [Clostridiales bacterium]|nr:chemotaxis protein CheC [Clostridiales bacterium]